MLQNMDKELIEMIELSEDIARRMKANYVGSEHLLLALLKSKKSLIRVFVSKYGMSYSSVKEDLLKCYIYSQDIRYQFTKIVEEILNDTMRIAYQETRELACIKDLELALCLHKSSVAYELLMEYEVSIDELILFIERDKLMNELNKIKELQNLNIKMENEKQIVLQREKEINTIMTILSRKEKANPLLIGEPGIGKSAIVEEVARRIAQKEVAPCLQDIVIYELNINNLVAGTKYRGEFEEKMEKICTVVKKYKNAVLFIDEIHQIVGAGKAEGSIDVATVFKPYLARSEIKVIGATTINEYNKYIENDRALERRFQTITILEPKKEDVFEMVKNKIKTLSNYHQVEIPDSAIKLAIEESDTYLINRHYPDKAIDIVDLAATRAKLRKGKIVDEVDIVEIVEELSNVRHSLFDQWNVEDLFYKYPSCSDEIKKLKESYEVSVYRVDKNNPRGIYYLMSKKREEVCDFGRDVLKSLSNNNFKGIEIPMRLYNEPSSLYYLTSSKEGPFYKPWNELKKSPQMVFLLQNFDLAHSDVQQFFKRIFELGRWKDADGKEYDFRNSIFLLTEVYETSSMFGLERKEDTQSTLESSNETIVLPPFSKAEFSRYASLMMENWNVEISEDLLNDCYESNSNRGAQIKQLKRIFHRIKSNQNA